MKLNVKADNRISDILENKSDILSVYFTAGFPKLDSTLDVIKYLDSAGVDMIEIGIPFSDPIADGEVIQRSSQKALGNGMSVRLLFEQLQEVRSLTDIPLIAMGYLNPIYRYGFEDFCHQCKEVGIDGLIIPDLPLQEIKDSYANVMDQHNLKNIMLISPNTSEERIRTIDDLCKGFVYMVSSASTTGAKSGISDQQIEYFNKIKKMNLNNPAIIGFGISDRTTFDRACKYAQGAIIGSAFIKHMEEFGLRGNGSQVYKIYQNMIIQLERNISSDQQLNIKEEIEDLKYKVRYVKTQEGNYLVGIGKTDFDIRNIGQLEGVRDIHIVSDDYKLVSGKWKVEPTVIDLGDGVLLGGSDFAIMAGPCSIEGEDQIKTTIDHLKKENIPIMRGGVFKPRSSPYSFRGLGADGLRIWSELAKEAGIKIISEVMQVSQVEEMYDYVDIYQVGARNTQNFNLLDALGKVDKPVLIKRGISGTIDELLYSAEYVFSGGNERLLLCERGIRTFETASRNTLDLNAIPILKTKTHLPVISDPSHGIGIREYVEPMALASVMAGADGIIYEIHQYPEKAMSDAQQTLDFDQSARLVRKVRKSFDLRETLID